MSGSRYKQAWRQRNGAVSMPSCFVLQSEHTHRQLPFGFVKSFAPRTGCFDLQAEHQISSNVGCLPLAVLPRSILDWAALH